MPVTSEDVSMPPPPGWVELQEFRAEVEAELAEKGTYGLPLEDFIKAVEERVGPVR